MKKILLAGITGYLGGFIAHELQKRVIIGGIQTDPNGASLSNKYRNSRGQR